MDYLKYQKIYNNNYSCVDRFIPRRRGSDFDASKYLLNKTVSPLGDLQPTGDARYVNYAYVNWKKELYRERLWSVLVPNPQKVLNFSETSNKPLPKHTGYPLWPVKGRKKPLIGSPSMVLDMPNLEANICHHVTDWSKKGYLASVYEGEIYLWHPDTNFPHLLTNTEGKVEKCVCWNQSSTHFGIGMDNSRLAVWDFQKNQNAHQTVCICGTATCTITSMAWSSRNQLISGCNLGRLCVWSSDLSLLRTIGYAHNGTIITIALSCAERYLATTATDGPVIIWVWPQLRQLFEICYHTPIRGIAWHPSKDSIFAVGGNLEDGSIALWSASNIAQIGFKPSPNESYLIDNLTFNSLTGELVVSYWQEHRNYAPNSGKNSIVIFSNLEKKVDAIEWHSDRVLYLMWGEDGTKLGTAAADENFCVWDFFGTSPEVIKSYKEDKKQRKLSMINPFDSLASFGHSIR